MSIEKFVNWIFLNYSGSKNKNSPSGLRSNILSTKLEALISKVSESEDAVATCLPLLMKSVLTTDFKLRDLTKAN